MSTSPTRYTLHLDDPNGDSFGPRATAEMVEHPKGSWVHHDDYAALAAERDTLHAQVHAFCHDLHVTNPAVTPQAFCDGCEAYQQKLFGTSPITDLRAEVADWKVGSDVEARAGDEARADCRRLRAALAALVGGETVAELQGMRLIIIGSIAPETDKAAIVAAIDLLIELESR